MFIFENDRRTVARYVEPFVLIHFFGRSYVMPNYSSIGNKPNTRLKIAQSLAKTSFDTEYEKVEKHFISRIIIPNISTEDRIPNGVGKTSLKFGPRSGPQTVSWVVGTPLLRDCYATSWSRESALF